MARIASFGLTAVGVFLFFGATMAALAAITLSFPGTQLDRIWQLNPRAYAQLAPLRSRVGPVFFLLGAALAAAGIGWFQRRFWGWLLAVIIIATQVAGDFMNLVRGDFLRGTAGVLIAGFLLTYLLSRQVRNNFE